mgnify:CR=1 FL=1
MRALAVLRPAGSDGWLAARATCATRLAELGYEPRTSVFRFPGSTEYPLAYVNVVGVKRGAKRPSEEVIVSAHYDHIYGCPGADDDASGVASTLEIARLLAADFDTVFYPGGHGPMWDLAEDARSVALIEAFYGAGKPVAAVCHAPAVLRHVKRRDGSSVVKGSQVAGFTNSEEQAAGLSEIVPFRVEDMLRAQGGEYSKAEDWQPHVVVDGRLVTGQNPASSEPAAHALLKKLG